MTTNSKCYYNGRKIVSYSDDDNNNTRIVGGGETSAHEYPFMVRIAKFSQICKYLVWILRIFFWVNSSLRRLPYHLENRHMACHI